VCHGFVSKNWMALPAEVITKIVPNEEDQMKFVEDLKVDARCITDRLENIEHAVSVAPIKLYNLATEVKNCSARITNMEREISSIKFYLQEIFNKGKDTKEVSAPLKKKPKMVSFALIVHFT